MERPALPAHPIRRVREYLADGIRIDTRSLAVFRIFAGMLIVADVVSRSRNFSFYYTDDGLVPQELAEQQTADGAFSFFYYTSDPDAIAALFVLQVFVAALLIVGYRTRVASVLAFLFVVSTDHHNPLVLSYADVLFRLLLFWAIFLPLGERWSIDAVHRDREPRASIASVASALILFQMIFMYFVNGLHKTQSDLWTSGEAAPLVLGLDEMTFLLGDYVRQYPTLLELGGLTWFYGLLLSPLLLLLRRRRRYLFAALFVGGHVSFALTVRIGAFAYVALTGLVLFLQAQFWRDLQTVAHLVGVADSGVDSVSTAFTRAAGAVPRFGFDGPAFGLDPETRRHARGALYNVGFGVVVVSLVLFSAATVLHAGGVVDEEFRPDRDVESAAERLSVTQPSWSVFAPHPRTTDRYYVFAARTDDGEVYDAFNDRELAYDRPYDELQKQHDTYRMRFYMNSIRRGHGDDPGARELLAEHLCTTWEEERGITLTHVNMYEIREDVTRDTIDDPEGREREWRRFYHHGCGDRDRAVVYPIPEDMPRVGQD